MRTSSVSNTFGNCPFRVVNDKEVGHVNSSVIKLCTSELMHLLRSYGIMFTGAGKKRVSDENSLNLGQKIGCLRLLLICTQCRSLYSCYSM